MPDAMGTTVFSESTNVPRKQVITHFQDNPFGCEIIFVPETSNYWSYKCRTSGFLFCIVRHSHTPCSLSLHVSVAIHYWLVRQVAGRSRFPSAPLRKRCHLQESQEQSQHENLEG